MLAEVPLRGVRDRVFLLRSLDSLAPLDDEALTRLAEHAKTRRFDEGDVLMVEGEPLDRVYMVIEGLVRVRKEGRLVADAQRGRGIGFLGVLTDTPECMEAFALEETHAIEVPAEALRDAMEENFSIIRNALRMASETLVRRRGNLPAQPGSDREVDEGAYFDRPQTLIERLLEMRTLPLLSQANLDAVFELARRVTEYRFEPGEVFWEVGDPSVFHLRLLCGRVRCTSADGQSVDVGSGFVLGVMDSLSLRPRSYRAVAVTRGIAHRTGLADFLGVLETHHDMALNLLARLSDSVLREQIEANARDGA